MGLFLQAAADGPRVAGFGEADPDRGGQGGGRSLQRVEYDELTARRATFLARAMCVLTS